MRKYAKYSAVQITKAVKQGLSSLGALCVLLTLALTVLVTPPSLQAFRSCTLIANCRTHRTTAALLSAVSLTRSRPLLASPQSRHRRGRPRWPLHSHHIRMVTVTAATAAAVPP
jgi:hypothetical protein